MSKVRFVTICFRLTQNSMEANFGIAAKRLVSNDGSSTPRGTKKLRRHDGLIIDINKAPHCDDDNFTIPLASGKQKSAPPPPPSPHRLLLLKIKKQQRDISAKRVALKQQHCGWASANLKKDLELEKMRLENKMMKLDNELLEAQVKYKEEELGLHVKSKRI